MSQRERELAARLATAVGLLSKSLHVLADSAHTDVIRAFLASAQPAAPAREETFPYRTQAELSALYSAAAPARAESFDLTTPEGAVDAYNAMGERCLERTEAEQAVLDACAAADIESTGGRNRMRRQFMFELQEDAVCRAELARREAAK